MRIISLTPIGKSIASNPSNSNTPAMRVLFFLRRQGGSATDERIVTYGGISQVELNMALRSLVSNKAVTVST